MSSTQEYFESISGILKEIVEKEQESITRAAELVAGMVEEDRRIDEYKRPLPRRCFATR